MTDLTGGWPSRRRALLARFRRDRGGATAVEFAIISIPFLLLLFGIVEVALVLLLSTSLDGAVSGAARRIRTGELQTAGQSAQQFKDDVCARMTWSLGGCSSSLSVDTRTFTSFASVNGGDMIQNGALKNMCWQPGGPEDIVLTRAFYKWQLLTPLMQASLARLSGGQALITSTAVFRNEQYGPRIGSAACPS